MRALATKRIRTVPRLAARHRDSHKGDFGRVLVIGGSRGMVGAPALAANAALRSGAGLVTVACPEVIQLAAAMLCPCATSIALPQSNDGMIEPGAALKVLRKLIGGESGPTVVAAGPGLGRGTQGFDRGLMKLWAAMRNAGLPMVLDADALNAMHKSGRRMRDGWDRTAWRRTVITPHPGELARMQNVLTSEIQSQRGTWAIRTANEMGRGITREEERPVVVLKGAQTVVTDGQRVYMNSNGNPGMATGGSGDVLTGVIAALIGQGMSCFDAALLGVHVHGAAGDAAAKVKGEVSLIASELVDYLPAAFRKR